jgi:hypothetical protein
LVLSDFATTFDKNSAMLVAALIQNSFNLELTLKKQAEMVKASPYFF